MDWFYLVAITLLGATIQSATGFGFGLIAVPIFLLIIKSTDAIQMVMVIILCMSVLDWLKLKGLASFKLLLGLNVGMLLGFPLGLMVFQQLDLSMLKLIIALIILLFSLYSFVQIFNQSQFKLKDVNDTKNWKTLSVGFISGIMTTSLAMPGPSVMMYLVQQHLDKTLIRATILTYFIFAYAGGLIMQTFTVGIASNTWLNALYLVPVALLGVLLGHKIAPNINQKLFKKIILSILMIMSVVMLYQL